MRRDDVNVMWAAHKHRVPNDAGTVTANVMFNPRYNYTYCLTYIVFPPVKVTGGNSVCRVIFFSIYQSVKTYAEKNQFTVPIANDATTVTSWYNYNHCLT